MTDIVSPLLQWLNTHPELAGIVTFTISAAESVAIIGTIVPGSITMTAIGTLAGAGVIPLWQTIIWAILGAVVGDGISYWIGHYFKDGLRKIWPFRNNPGILKSGEIFVHKYGVMSVFIGRFVGPVRALVPLIAGMLGMKPLLFTIANITSAIGWAPVYMLPGILLGAASLELPPDIAMHVILVLMLISLFILLCLWLIYKILQLIHFQTTQMQNWIWDQLQKSRVFSPMTVLLKHYRIDQTHGQLILAFYFILSSILFLALTFYIKSIGVSHVAINDISYHLFRGLSIRSELLNDIMIDITLLGQNQVILPVVIVFAAWMMFKKRWRLAAHIFALTILTAGSIFVLKHIIQSPRPWGIAFSSESFSMPSGHTTLATTFFLGFALLIASSVRPRFRWPIYVISIFLIFIIAFSRLYLGAHWLTDILSSFLLSIALLIFIVISYRRQYEAPIVPIEAMLICFVMFAITLGGFRYYYIDQLHQNYTQLSLPTKAVDMKEWWEKDLFIPTYRVSLFGLPSQRINIQWIGNIEQIKNTLLKEGWSKPPARDWISTLHRIADVSSTEYLPMISPQYLDKKPELLLTRPVNHGKGLLVIRLWNSNCYVAVSNEILWVGIVGSVPRSYSWLFKKHAKDNIEIETTLLFPKKMSAKQWESKILTINLLHKKNKHIKQKMLLIRHLSATEKR